MIGKPPYISREQIENLNITPEACIRWAQEALMIKDNVRMPPKLSVCPQGSDFITSMPCLLPAMGGGRYFGIKVVSRIEGNHPVLKSTITLYDADSGDMLAVLDGDWITSMRTGAAAALAASMFKKRTADTYSLMGLGNIARAVTKCIIADNSGRSITFRLLRYKDQAEKFVESFGQTSNVAFEIVDDKTAFVREAEVLISCVTVANELLFPVDSLFSRGITLIPVHTRGFQNCDLFFDKIFGDDIGQIRRFKYFDRFRHFAELHKVLQGKVAGREDDNERVLCYNYGIALHDIFFAARIYESFQ